MEYYHFRFTKRHRDSEEINKITMKHKIAKDFVKALEEEIAGQKKITTDDN